MTAPNAELAYRVLDHIDAHPEQHDQGAWYGATECGTIACFAGWAVALAGHNIALGDPDEDGFRPWSAIDGDSDAPIQTVAIDDLGIGGHRVSCALGCDDCGVTTAALTALFDASNSREKLGRLVAEIFGPRPTDDCICKGADLPHAQGLRGCVDGPVDRPLDDVPPNAGSQS